MRFHFVILVPFSKHEILKEKISFSSRTPRFIRQKSRLVSKLEIWKKIFSISSRTTRFRETKISISSQKIHISRCILLIIIQKQVQMYWLIQYIPGPKSMYAIWNHGSWQFELFHWHLSTGMHGLTCHPSSLSRPLSLSSNSWKDLCTHPYKRWKLYKNESQKKSRSRLENWDEMTEFLALVSKPEIRWKNSHARLEARDWKKEILDLVSKHEIERKKILISSRSMRLEERNSRSRLGHEIERQIFSIPSRKLK